MARPILTARQVQTWLVHVVGQWSMRRIARREGVAPSTVLRRIRAVEDASDNPAVDAFLDRAAAAWDAGERLDYPDFVDMRDSWEKPRTPTPRSEPRPRSRRKDRRKPDPVVELYHRRRPDLITHHHVHLARELRAAPRLEVRGDPSPLGPVLAEVLDLAVRKDWPAPDIEDRLGLPARSAKVALAFALDLYARSRAAAHPETAAPEGLPE